MSYDALFQLANALVLPQWLLIWFAPRWGFTKKLVDSLLIPALIGGLYVYLLATASSPLDPREFGSWAGVRGLFSKGNDATLLAGWVHYLAFDLLAGSWVWRDSQERGIAHGWVLLPLFFCFLLGPVGVLLYAILRLVFRKRIARTSFGK
ncbi:MAG: DUF4281 domain-containing protein [Cytophagaceae bacterium]|nr:DUF4281 domain-containing protein [Cytophagaceae bacterium]